MEDFYDDKSLNTKIIMDIPDKFPNYCCPSCSEIPEILNFNENDSKILLKCQKHGKKLMNIHDYLKSIDKILKSCKIKSENQCSKHNLPLDLFCKTCEINLCLKCNDENKNHSNHIKYKSEDIYPNSNEIALIMNKINIYINEKYKLLLKLVNLNDKIIFYDTIINAIQRESTNFYKNINVKHIIYGEEINLNKMYKDKSLEKMEKKLNIDDIINKNTIDLIKNKNELNLLNKKTGDDFLLSLFNNNLNDIIKQNNNTINKDIMQINKNILEKLKIINVKGNKMRYLNFLSNKTFYNLELLILNDNKITNIEPLKEMNAPLIKQLFLSKNNINSIKPLEYLKMNNLQILWLSENDIFSIDTFKNCNLKKLERLGLNKNKINNIKVFKKPFPFPLLIELYINDNNINFESSENQEIIEMLEKRVKDFFY